MHTRHTRVHTIWMVVNIYIYIHIHVVISYINILDAGSLACFNLGVYATRPQNTEQRNTMEDPDQRWWGFPHVIIVGQVHQNSSPVLMQRRTICMETGNSTLFFDVFQDAFTLYNINIYIYHEMQKKYTSTSSKTRTSHEAVPHKASST